MYCDLPSRGASGQTQPGLLHHYQRVPVGGEPLSIHTLFQRLRKIRDILCKYTHVWRMDGNRNPLAGETSHGCMDSTAPVTHYAQIYHYQAVSPLEPAAYYWIFSLIFSVLVCAGSFSHTSLDGKHTCVQSPVHTITTTQNITDPNSCQQASPMEATQITRGKKLWCTQNNSEGGTNYLHFCNNTCLYRRFKASHTAIL